MRLLIAPAAVLGVMGLSALMPGPKQASKAAGICRAGEAVTTRFGEWFSPNTAVDHDHLTVTKVVPPLAAPAVGVRLQMEATSPAGERWSVALRDPQLRILAILTEQDFGLAKGGTATQWTGRLEAPQVSAELIGAGPGVRIRFSAGMALPADSSGVNVFSSQTNQPAWSDPFETKTILYERATEAVGMMVTGLKAIDGQGVPRNESWCCSGAMLTPDIFITNWHCGAPANFPDSMFWSDQVRSNAIIDLGWQKGSAPRRQYMVTEVLRTNERLDYALLRVRPTIGPGAATGRAIPVKVSRQLPAEDGIFVVHHAECKAKLVSFNCNIDARSYRAWTDPLSKTSGPDITHRCDTEPGASGSPVFDMEGKMIALHHLGFQKAVPGQCQADQVNKAVTMDSIYADVQQAKPTIYAELMHQ